MALTKEAREEFMRKRHSRATPLDEGLHVPKQVPGPRLDPDTTAGGLRAPQDLDTKQSGLKPLTKAEAERMKPPKTLQPVNPLPALPMEAKVARAFLAAPETKQAQAFVMPSPSDGRSYAKEVSGLPMTKEDVATVIVREPKAGKGVAAIGVIPEPPARSRRR